MAKYVDQFGFIHNAPRQTKPIDYKKELDRLYRKAFPTSDKDKQLKPNDPNNNEVKRFHKLINNK